MQLQYLLRDWLSEKGFTNWTTHYPKPGFAIKERVVMSHSDHIGLTRMILEDQTKIVKIEYLLRGSNAWYNLTNSILDMSDPDSFDKLEEMLKGLE